MQSQVLKSSRVRCGQPVAQTQVALPQPRPQARSLVVVAAAPKAEPQQKQKKKEQPAPNLVELGPIGLSFGADAKAERPKTEVDNGLGVALGPISLSYGTEFGKEPEKDLRGPRGDSEEASSRPASIHSMTTAEWRAKYEREDGTVDLWMEEEFNAGSRLVGGRVAHFGGMYGIRTGEGPSQGNVATHKVKITNTAYNSEQIVELEVPEDRYILWEAEDHGLELPYACRMGCCTACAVRVHEGEVYQPEALGISQELRDKGYALMCVGYPLTDCVMETVTEDEVYELQFGKYFAQQALDPNNAETIERDDYALSIANMDE